MADSSQETLAVEEEWVSVTVDWQGCHTSPGRQPIPIRGVVFILASDGVP